MIGRPGQWCVRGLCSLAVLRLGFLCHICATYRLTFYDLISCEATGPNQGANPAGQKTHIMSGPFLRDEVPHDEPQCVG